MMRILAYIGKQNKTNPISTVVRMILFLGSLSMVIPNALFHLKLSCQMSKEKNTMTVHHELKRRLAWFVLLYKY